jgi:hypothetical protein
MALYQNQTYLTFSTSVVFNQAHKPGDPAPYGGIYRCTGCGLEIASARGHSLPPQNHHQHTNRLVPIRWQAEVLHG